MKVLHFHGDRPQVEAETGKSGKESQQAKRSSGFRFKCADLHMGSSQSEVPFCRGSRKSGTITVFSVFLGVLPIYGNHHNPKMFL